MATPRLTLRYVALTDTGLRRANNEDSGYASSQLLIVADGMGGAAGGEIASSETVDEIRHLDNVDLSTGALALLEQSVAAANTRLAGVIYSDPSVEGMGTTLEALAFDGEKIAWAHIGDSRVYRLRQGKLAQLSTDHTLVQSLVEEGRITAAEARVHPHRSLILRAMLGRDDNDADLSWLQPSVGDRFLLCSDGLSDMIDADVIENDLRADSIDQAATELVRHALEAGGYDNVTVVIGEFVVEGTEIDPNASCADGRPQVVGAAAEGPQGRRRPAIESMTPRGREVASETVAADPEELRYAPRPPSNRRGLRLLVALSLVIAALTGAAAWAYDWSQRQYFVAANGDKVAIFSGVPLTVPWVELSHVEETTTISVAALPRFQRERVTAGIGADSRAQAEKIIAELQADSAPSPASPATPGPTPGPAPTTTAPTTTAPSPATPGPSPTPRSSPSPSKKASA